MIPVNKTITFYSPIEGDDDVFVRTGTIPDGSCFYHALLHAYSKDYVAMDKKGRMKFVKRLRASLAGKVDKESWEGVGGGLIAKVPFQEKVHFILLNFYKFMASDDSARGKSTRKVIKTLINDDREKLEYIRLLTEIVPFEDIEKQILPAAYGECEDKKILDCKTAIKKEVHKHLESVKELDSLDDNRLDYIYTLSSEIITTILDEAENSTFKEYVENLQNTTEEVDSYTIELISERFNRDIYFLDAQTRLPYQNASQLNLKGRKSMIVLWVGKNHYEIVGRWLPGCRIQREFDADDSIIKKLYTFLCDSDQIREKYPDMIPYLPKNSRSVTSPSQSSAHSTYDSSSDSDEDSDYSRYSDSDNSETDAHRKIVARA